MVEPLDHCLVQLGAGFSVCSCGSFLIVRLDSSQYLLDRRLQRGFLSDVKRAAYAVGREIQCSLLEQEQAIRPDEFSVEAPRPEKARSSKGKEEPDR